MNIDIELIVRALGTRDATILTLQTQVAEQGREIERLKQLLDQPSKKSED